MPDHEQNTQAARRTIERFLEGSGAGTDLDRAVETLRRDDPGWLRDLQRRLDLVSHDAVCALVASSLDEYAGLGAGAAQAMPAVAGHLASCAECREHFELYVGVEREVAPAWQDFARSLAPPVLTFQRALRKWAAAAERIGAWITLPAAPLPVALAATPPVESRRLLLRLPDEAGALEVTVTPAIDEDWQIELRLDPASAIASIVAGIGDEASPHLGTRDLRPNRPATFPVDPPVGATYWLHLRWTSAGSTRNEKFPLPFAVEE